MSAGTIDVVLAAIDAAARDTEEQLAALLRIPSVSAQPAHAADCARAADLLARSLAAIGFDVAIDPTPGHPIVRGFHPGPAGGAGRPHVLYYGHYDVQPPEPLEPWHTPPFEPAFVDGPLGRRVVARGAADDKGQVMTWLASLAAWHRVAGGPPCPVTVLIEGEEEIGSAHLEAYLAERATTLGGDVALISDTGMWNPTTPAITARLRGLVYAEVTLEAAAVDLHSGLYGGVALNPLNVLTRVLGALTDERGAIAIPGFYNDVRDPSPSVRSAWAALGFDDAAFLRVVGLTGSAGEQGRLPLERLWSRPTVDINGLSGGYQGHGAKTVIAREARAKVSFRLVPDQDPDAVAAAFERFVRDRLPTGVTARFDYHGRAPGIAINTETPVVAAARAGLADEYGCPAALIGSGGSIPVVETLRNRLGIDSVLIGFGLHDDGVHGPNEKFELASLHHGSRAHARILQRIAVGAG